jgi:hypothetical protein
MNLVEAVVLDPCLMVEKGVGEDSKEHLEEEGRILVLLGTWSSLGCCICDYFSKGVSTWH